MIEADAIDYIFFVTCIFTDILIKYDLILYICLIYCKNLKERRFHRLYPPVQCLDLLLLGSLLGLPHCHISWLSDKLFTCCWYAYLLPLVLWLYIFWILRGGAFILVFYKWLVLVKKWKKKDQLFVGPVYFNKIPSEMEVTPLLTLLTSLTWFTLLTLSTLFALLKLL